MAENKIMGMLSLGAPIRKGPQGPQGPVGPTGPVGPRGERGEAGPAGPQGERGIEGMPGPQGPRGLQGAKGERGLQGAQGPQGIEGPPGPQGNQGVPGATGPQGIQGAKGEKGDRGDGLRVKGTVNSESDIQEPKKAGDIYFVESKNQLVVWTGEKWVNLGTIRGPQGEKGPKGDQGPTGAQGLQGERGPQGERGQQGPIGPTGPQGNKGESGKDGVLIEDSKVSNVNTWSSKQIIDHLLQDNEWKEYNNEETLSDAANGYIRGLTIEGNTHEGQGVGLETEKGYKIGVKTHGKNLFNEKTIKISKNIYWNTGQEVPQNDYIASDFIEIKANTKYVIKGLTTYNSDIRIVTYDIDKNGIVEATQQRTTITTKENSKYLRFAFKKTEWAKGKIQLEEGTQATSYEPYKESTSEIIIERQLSTGDKLTYDNTKGKYIITLANKEIIDTEIKTELLPQTYKNKTYISVDSGVKPTLKGEYAIDNFKESIKNVLRELKITTPGEQTPSTLEEIEEDEPTTLEEFQDGPTTLEEV